MEEKIIREEGKDGKVVYKLENGREIGTYHEDLFDIFNPGFETLQDFFDLLIDKNPEDKTSDIGKQLVERIENKMVEMIRFIEVNYGRIKVARAEHRQDIIPGTMLGVIFEPKGMAVKKNEKKYWYGVKIKVKAYDEFMSYSEKSLREHLAKQELDEFSTAEVEKYEITELSLLGEVDLETGGCKGHTLLCDD